MYVSRITAALAATTLLTACQMNGMLEQKDPLIPATTRAALADTCGAGDLTFMAGMRVARSHLIPQSVPYASSAPKVQSPQITSPSASMLKSMPRTGSLDLAAADHFLMR